MHATGKSGSTTKSTTQIMDEITQQSENQFKLNLDILKAIEIFDKNNLDSKNIHKVQIARVAPTVAAVELQTTTNADSLTEEHIWVNPLEMLRTQIEIERKHAEEIRRELLQEKLQSQDIQKKDIIVIKAMRKRLETALAQEEELHKQLVKERQRRKFLQSLLTASFKKNEMARDKELLQERVVLQTQEIKSLEARIGALREAESRRIQLCERQQREITKTAAEIGQLKIKLDTIESERDSLLQKVQQLRSEIGLSAANEAQLAETLHLLQKFEEINILVEDRWQLQKKCENLTDVQISELKERCNHLLGRYLRVESHRKELVCQKRYLKLLVQNYQETTMAAINDSTLLMQPQPPRNKKRLFKTVVMAIIAIQRMKFIGRNWRTKKRLLSKSLVAITQQTYWQFSRIPD